MIELIKELSLLNGVSGREYTVRDYIVSSVKNYADDVFVDALGNLIVFKKGDRKPDNIILLDAHMDEVGFVVTYVNPDGTLKFDNVGGIDSKSIIGKNVSIGDNNIPGVIGIKPVHLCSSDERSQIPGDLYIDIGTCTDEETSKFVSLGDSVCFSSSFEFFGESFIKGKALDDRAGCAVLISLIKSKLPYDVYFSFSTCEETGSGFAGVAAERIKPDYALVVETTTASDISTVEDGKKVCLLGGGPVISFMDRRTVYPYDLFKRVMDTAENNNIKVQVKKAVAGGNNAGCINKSAGGIKTIAVSMPCRYLHSPSCVLNTGDINYTRLLLETLISELAND